MRKTVGIVFLTVFLCGCWDKTELNERAFINAVAVDIAEEGDGFAVGVAVSDLSAFGGSESQDESSEQENKNVKKSNGRSVSGALRGSEEYSSQKLFFGQSKAAVIGERLAKDKEHFLEALDAFERDTELSRKNYVFISEGGAVEAISAKAEGEPSFGFFADSYFRARGTEAFAMSLEGLFIQLRNCGNALVPKISVEDGEVRLGGAAVIRDFRHNGFIDETKLRGLLWATGDVKGTKIITAYDGANIPFTALAHKKTIGFHEEGDTLVMEIGVKTDGNIGEYSFGKAYDEVTLAQIENAVAKEIEKEVTEAFSTLQKDFKTDATDTKRTLKKKNYALWLKYCENWQEAFEGMGIEVNAAANVKSAGRIR